MSAVGALGSGASPAVAARGIDVGLTDSVFNGAERSAWLDRADGVHTESVLLGAPWVSIAPGAKPSKNEARDPGFGGYNWTSLDASVREVAARGMQPMVLVTGAPAWAEGRNRPGFDKAPAGTWKPKPGPLGDFGTAIAKRYSGDFDPDGVLVQPALPRVREFQLWAEPNLSAYLTPQYRGKKRVAGDIYRNMLRGFYEGIKRPPGKATVLTGGTAPYGDLEPGGLRTQPVAFWRDVMCLRGRRALEPQKCKPAKFDVLSHHPINVGAPTRHALNADDASTPDIGRIRRVLNTARQTNRIAPGGSKPIYATEIWWDSDPPDPNGVPERQHANYLADSFYILWKQNVRKVIWFQIRDQECAPSCAATPQTGLFLRGGNPKLAADAFRFPFVADRRGKNSVFVWGLAPNGGDVKIERKRNGNWHKVAEVRAGGNRVFAEGIRLRGKSQLRASAAGEDSLSRTAK